MTQPAAEQLLNLTGEQDPTISQMQAAARQKGLRLRFAIVEDEPEPARHTVDTITSDALDQLHARLAAAEQEADEAVAAAAHLTRLVGKRSEKAERNAKRQHLRADLAETELRTLRAGLRANGADPTQIQNLWAQIHLRNRQWREEKQRAERAEAAVATFAAIFEGFGNLLATSSRDWAEYAVDAWLYAVVLGWDCEETEHDDTCTHGVMEEMAEAHGWDEAAVAKARRYRAAVRAALDPQEPQP
ncbi:hypothetical protein [Streptomyces roseoviridis]|uniref:Tail assembly chaperone n=1 Tax=Streptomyces roseoviridis TaxID=67361 RepID=A0ABV5QYT8_9ACTN